MCAQLYANAAEQDPNFLRELVARLGREVYRIPGLPLTGYGFVLRARRAGTRGDKPHIVVTLSREHAAEYVAHGSSHPTLRVEESRSKGKPGKGKNGKGKGRGSGRGSGRGRGRGFA